MCIFLDVSFEEVDRNIFLKASIFDQLDHFCFFFFSNVPLHCVQLLWIVLLQNLSMCCFLCIHLPDVDLLVLQHPAQSESVQPTTFSDSFWYLYQFTTLGYRTRYLPILTSLFQSSLVGDVPRNSPLLWSSCILSSRLNAACHHRCRRQSCHPECHPMCARSNLASSPRLFHIPFLSRLAPRWSWTSPLVYHEWLLLRVWSQPHRWSPFTGGISRFGSIPSSPWPRRCPLPPCSSSSRTQPTQVPFSR